MNASRALPLLALPLLVAASALAQRTAALPSLGVGDKAPAISVAKWVKGTPKKGFELGKVYVVEFWATWCPPCRESIPHLTELQKRYGNAVSFNGFAVWQREPKDAYIGSVEKFVTKMGPKMDYSVAVDTDPRTGAMAVNWMTAAGQNGIPTAFVVGKDGRIAYIGHPMDPGLPDTLDKVLAGTFDANAAKNAARAKAERETNLRTAFGKVAAAYKAGDEAAADAVFADLAATYPDLKGNILAARFERKLDTGKEAEGYALLKTEWPGAINDPETLNSLSWTILTDKRAKNPDTALAIALAQKGVELTGERSAAVIDTLAYALFKGGKMDEAVAWETKAVKLTDGKDAEMVAALEKYRKAKRG